MHIRDKMQEYDIFDNSILSHGFTDYMRDYRMVVYSMVGSQDVGYWEYLFKACVECNYQTTVTTLSVNGWTDDVFIDRDVYESSGQNGFLWGLKFSPAYPGWTYVEDSPRASSWADVIGMPMHEVGIETNHFNLTLVFHDLDVRRIPDSIGDKQWGAI